MRISDWSSDVCSSDLLRARGGDDGALATGDLVQHRVVRPDAHDGEEDDRQDREDVGEAPPALARGRMHVRHEVQIVAVVDTVCTPRSQVLVMPPWALVLCCVLCCVLFCRRISSCWRGSDRTSVGEGTGVEERV